MNILLRGAAVGAGALALALPLAAHPGVVLHVHAGEILGLAVVLLALALLPARTLRRNRR